MTRSRRAVLSTALILRLAWGFAIPVIPVSDGHLYDDFAQRIAQGGGYAFAAGNPTAFWPVGTSAIYALVYRVFGHDFLPIVLLQALVGVAVVGLAMAMARRWLGEAESVITGWTLACWPQLIEYTTILASELYFMLFVLLAFWLASMPGRSWPGRALLSGVALAAASYVRPLAVVMAPLLFLRTATHERRRAQALLASVVATVALLACILPWSLRNWRVFDRFVLISTNGGVNLWFGNNASGSIDYMEAPGGSDNEADWNAQLGAEARRYIAQDPGAFAWRALKKAYFLHDRESIGVVWNQPGISQRLGEGLLRPLKLLNAAYWWAVLLPALFGVVAIARVSGVAGLLACPPLLTWSYFALVHCVTVTGDRYHIPSVPFVAMLAASAIVTIPARERGGSRASTPRSEG